MSTGSPQLEQNPSKSREPFGGLGFDPRPWPIVVLMLLGLWAVYWGLRPRDLTPAKPGSPAAPPVAAQPHPDAILAAGVLPPALPAMNQTFEQGVKLTFSQATKTDARAARVLSLFVSAGERPTPFLSPGPFTATWSGFLNVRLRTEVTFSVLGRGKVLLRVAGKDVLDASGDDFAGKASPTVKLEKGRNAIEVVYTSPEKGDAWVRVLWSSRDWPAEPVQPASLSYDASDQQLREAMRIRDGRELFANLRCAKCHALPDAPKPESAMPELATDAPDLSDAGARLKPAWIAAWIADPRALRPDASMPRIAHASDGAKHLAAYLATLGKPADAQPHEPTDEEVALGGQLFAALGCIGCHTKPDADEIDKSAPPRVPLKLVNAKFQPGALRAWLLDPQAHYKWTRMPNFHLSEFEADRLVAYLSKNAKGEVPANPADGDAKQGRELFASAGCASCHAMKDIPATASRPMADLLASSDWAKGCLANDDAARAAAPDFGLSDTQRAALSAFAASGAASLANDVPLEFAQRSIHHLQCAACHARDEVEDRWSAVADDVADLMPPNDNIEGDQTDDAAKGPRLFVPRGLGQLNGGDRIVISGDQSRPALTWTGEKLRPEWSAAFIAGELTYKPRYWLRARMPSFPTRAKLLATGLALEHGFPPRSAAHAGPADSPDPVNQATAEIGQKLAGRDGGFACITCHSIADTRAISPFEAPAPNFIHIAERLTHDYYMRWMRKPMRLQPGTKMPQFSEDGRSTLKEILEGDADRQFEALWEYMRQGPKLTPPE